MNWEQVFGVLRHVLTFGGGYLVAKGYADDATVQAAVAGIGSLGALAWSIMAKRAS